METNLPSETVIANVWDQSWEFLQSCLCLKSFFQWHICVCLGRCCVFLYQELLMNAYINTSCKKINHHPSPVLQVVLEKLIPSLLKHASACRWQWPLIDFCRLRCACWTPLLFRPESRVKFYHLNQFLFECELSPTGSVWPLSLQVVTLFPEVVEPSGGGASQGLGLQAWFCEALCLLIVTAKSQVASSSCCAALSPWWTIFLIKLLYSLLVSNDI